MTTKKSHKSRQQQTRTAQTKTADKATSVSAAESAVGDASSSVPTAVTQSLLPASDLAMVLKATEGVPAGINDRQPTIVLPPPVEKQPYWFRTPESPTKRLFDKIIVMRTAGRPDADIAKKLKTTEANVRQTVWIAKKNGWLTDDGDAIDIEAQLAIEIDRKVVRNIGHVLDGGLVNHQTQEMTIAAAKGRGIFKNHEKHEGVQPNVLAPVAIQVIMPAIGAGDQTIIEENVGGLEAFVDGEVIDHGSRPGVAGALRDSTDEEGRGIADDSRGELPASGGVVPE